MEQLDGVELLVESVPKFYKAVRDSFFDLEIDPIAFPTVIDPMEYRKRNKGIALRSPKNQDEASSSKVIQMDIDKNTYESPTLYIDVPPDAQNDPYDDVEDWTYYINMQASDIDDLNSDGWDPSDRSPKGSW